MIRILHEISRASSLVDKRVFDGAGASFPTWDFDLLASWYRACIGYLVNKSVIYSNHRHDVS